MVENIVIFSKLLKINVPPPIYANIGRTSSTKKE